MMIKVGLKEDPRKTDDFKPSFHHIMDTPYMLSILSKLSWQPLDSGLVNVGNYTNLMGAPKP